MTSGSNELRKVHIYSPRADMHVDHIRKQFPELEVVSCWGEEELEKNLDEIEVLLAFRPPKDVLARAPRIGWIMTVGAGVDSVLPNPGLRQECIITNASGVHAPQISDYVVGVMLALALKLPVHIRNQTAKVWRMKSHMIVGGKTLAVLGLGSIGKEIARKASALGLRVIGTKKYPAPVDHVERVYGPDELHQVLGEADFVVLIVPLTPETRGLIGKAELEAMKPEAFLINAARGPVVVEDELVEALQNKTIAGAALDVFEKEPLPPESPLWEMENVIITPHNSGIRPDYNEAVSGIFCDNLRRYISGQPMLNLVSREDCY